MIAEKFLFVVRHGGCVFCRTLVNPVMNTETIEPVVSKTAPDSTVNVLQSDDSAAIVTESTSIQQELMVVDSYYSDGKPIRGWTPRSLLENPSNPQIQDDVISSSEAMQPGWL